MNSRTANVSLTYGIPAYKVPLPLFKRLLDSISTQHIDSYEILVVVDGTEENTELLKSGLLDSVPNLNVILQQHAGGSTARNNIIANAAGEWILFADADDYLYPNAAQHLLSAGETNHADLVVSNHSRITNDKELFIKYYANTRQWSTSESYDYIQHILSLGSDQGTVWSKLFRTDFLRKKLLYFDSSLHNGEDQEFMLRVVLAKPTISAITNSTYAYVYNPSSIVRSHDANYVNHILNTLNKVQLDLSNAVCPQDIQSIYLRYALDRLLLILRNYICQPETGTYSQRRAIFFGLIQLPLFMNALHSNFSDIDIARKVTLYAAKYKCFSLVNLIMTVRRLQQSQHRSHS